MIADLAPLKEFAALIRRPLRSAYRLVCQLDEMDRMHGRPPWLFRAAPRAKLWLNLSALAALHPELLHRRAVTRGEMETMTETQSNHAKRLRRLESKK